MSERFTARASRRKSFSHEVAVAGHSFVVDEPADKGGDDSGPTPRQLLVASLASCVAITVEMYAERKDWDVGSLEVEATYVPGERSRANSYEVELSLPEALAQDQVERIVEIAARCPVSRALLDAESQVEHSVRRV